MAANAAEQLNALRATLGKMEIALGAISDAIVWCNARGDIQWCNGSFDRLVGRTLHVANLGTRLVDLLPLEQHGRTVSVEAHPVNRALADPRGVREVYEFRQGDRRVVLAVTAASVSIIAQVTTILAIRDITEDMQATQALQEGRAYTENIVASLADTLIVVDPQGKLKTVNQATCALLGYTQEELIGHDVSLILAEEEEEEEEEEVLLKGTRLEKLIREGLIRDYELTYKTKSSETIPMSFSGSVMRGEDGAIVGVVGIARDVRETKKKTMELLQANEALRASRLAVLNIAQDAQAARVEAEQAGETVRKANTRLQELAVLKDEFVSNVSHELRTPLTAIKEGISLVLDEIPGAINDKQRRFLDIAKEDVDRLAGLLTTMLDLSKIEAGRMSLARKRLGLVELIEQTCQSYQQIAGKRRIIRDTRQVPAVFADPNRLIQVLSNLFSNAMKFTREDGMIRFRLEERNGAVAVSVQDDGVGIAEEDLPKLFQKFSQVGQRDGRPMGTGLGLALCKELVELHKGTITVTSAPQQGSTFTFTVPVYTAQFALEEYFEELVGVAGRTDQEGVGLIAMNGEPSSEELASFVRKHVHRGDVVLTVEPQWVVILAVTDASGLQAMLGRLRPLVREWADQRSGTAARIAVNLGVASFPADGADVHSLFAKATSGIKAE